MSKSTTSPSSWRAQRAASSPPMFPAPTRAIFLRVVMVGGAFSTGPRRLEGSLQLLRLLLGAGTLTSVSGMTVDEAILRTALGKTLEATALDVLGTKYEGKVRDN